MSYLLPPPSSNPSLHLTTGQVRTRFSPFQLSALQMTRDEQKKLFFIFLENLIASWSKMLL